MRGGGYEPYPTIDPSTTVPNDYQRIDVNPRQFGAQVGEAEQVAGQQLEQTGTFWGQIAADDQSNKWQREADDLLYGTGQAGPDGTIDQGYMGLQGADALRARPGLEAQLDAIRAKYRGGLDNQSALQFDDFTRRYQSNLMSLAGRHAEEAGKVYGVSVNDAGMANAERSIANSYNQPENFLHSREDMRMAAVRKAQLTGTSIAGALAEADSRSVLAAINGARARYDLPYAQKIYDQYGNDLDDKVRATVAEHLRAGSDAAAGNRLLNDVRSGHTPASRTAPGELSGPPDLVEYGKTVADKYGIPWDIFNHQIGGESGWNPGVAKSSAGAEGIAQFIPDTAKTYGVNVRDPRSSLEGAARYMADLHDQGGSWTAALTGYLSGNPRPVELTDVTSQNPEYAKAYQAARAADRGGAVPGAPPAAQPAGAPAQAGPRTIVAAGDSIAAGAAQAGKYNQTYEPRDLPEARHDVSIKAASGRFTDEALAAARLTADEDRGKVVLLSGGISNDLNGGRPLNDAISNTQEQIQLYKHAGAQVVLLGVGSGVRNYQQANSQLADLAKAESVPFTGELPTTQPASPGAPGLVHPRNYQAVIDKALSLLPQQPSAQGGAPAVTTTGATLVAQNRDQLLAPGQPSAQPIPTQIPPGAPATPAPVPPPGLEQLGQAELELTNNFAREQAQLEALGEGTPGKKNALATSEREFNAQKAKLTAARQALILSSEAARDGYIKRILQPQIDPMVMPDVANDPHLLAPDRENIANFFNQHAKDSIAGDITHYGDGFIDVKKRMLLPPTEPNRISDNSQLIAMSVPDESGYRWLTGPGLDESVKLLAQAHKPDGAAELKIQDSLIAAAKRDLDLSIDQPGYKLEDPGGKAAMASFLPAFYKYWNSPERLADQAKPMPAGSKVAPLTQAVMGIAQQFKRTPAEVQRDLKAMRQTMGETTEQTKIETPDDLRAAVEKGMSKEDATKIGIDRGWIAPPQAAAPPAVPEVAPPVR